jgi:hypothetical protein
VDVKAGAIGHRLRERADDDGCWARGSKTLSFGSEYLLFDFEPLLDLVIQSCFQPSQDDTKVWPTFSGDV